MMDESAVVGAYGENAAAKYLRAKGYAILDANFTVKSGEIDLVAEKNGEIAFIEVKTLRGIGFLRPIEKVTPEKFRRVVSASQLWLLRRGEKRPYHYDVIEVLAPDDLTAKPRGIEHTEAVRA